MPTKSNFTKTWIPGPSRGTQTFNAPSSLTVPYGRNITNVSGRGGSGTVPQASSWTTNYNTNYNVAYPIASQPIATQPATTWTTNYSTNYNVAYPIASQPIATQPATTWTTNYNTNYNVAHASDSHIGHYYTYHNFLGYQVHRSLIQAPSNNYAPGPHYPYQLQYWCPPGNHWATPWPGSPSAQWSLYSCPPAGPGNIAYGAYHVTNHYAIYPVANRPIANQPATAWTTNYNTNYNTVYPIANQPLANQPATAWTTNYNTNYNVAYPIANRPIANQPIAGYTPGNVGQSTNFLGVTFPGGPIDTSQFPAGTPGTASTVPETAVPYWSYPDNTTYPVSVPPGGQIVVKIE